MWFLLPMDDAALARSEHIMLSQFEVKEALPLTDRTTAELRPQSKINQRSIVFEHARRERDHGWFERDVNRDVHAGRISPNDEGTPYGLRIPPPMAATS